MVVLTAELMVPGWVDVLVGELVAGWVVPWGDSLVGGWAGWWAGMRVRWV